MNPTVSSDKLSEDNVSESPLIYDYYRASNWIYFDDNIDYYPIDPDSKGINPYEKIVIACKCSKVTIDSSGEIVSSRNIILVFRDWTIPERVSAKCSVPLSVGNKIIDPVLFIQNQFLDKNEMKYDNNSGFIFCKDVYGYEKFSKERGDLLYLARFKSIEDHKKFKMKSRNGFNINLGKSSSGSSVQKKISMYLNDSEFGVDIIDRFLAEVGIQASEWFKIPRKTDLDSNPDVMSYHEYKILNNSTETHTYNFNLIEKATYEEASMFDGVGLNLLYCCMDLECTSSTKTFPKEVITQDYITQISACFKSYKSDEILKNYLVTWLPTNDGDKVVFESTTDGSAIDYEVQDYELIVAKTEKEMIEIYFDLCRQYAPDAIIGHNTYGFDNPYINKRCEILEIDEFQSEPLQKINKKSYNYNEFSGKFGKVAYWQSTCAYLDTLTHYKAKAESGGPKLGSYSLDYICNYFLNFGKDDVTVSEMFDAFNETVKLIETYNSVIKLDKSITPEFMEEFKSRYEKILEDNKRIATYCVRDSVLVGKLLEYHNIFEELIEVANINNVDMVRLFSRGQQVRMINRLYRMAYEKDEDGNSPQYPIYTSAQSARKYKDFFQNNGYFGARVFTTVPGLHSPVLTVDFSSMYPSIMIAENMCYTTLVVSPLDQVGLTEDDVNVISTPIKHLVENKEDVPEEYEFVKDKISNTKIVGYYIIYYDDVFVKKHIF